MAGHTPVQKVDTSRVYYATQKELQAAQERAARRNAMKAEFMKKYTNPMKGATGAGHIFDPSMQRFMSMKVSVFEHYKFTAKNMWGFMWTTVLPILGIYKYLRWEKESNEKAFRSGSVTYQERLWKYN